jgi:hypothetical protein
MTSPCLTCRARAVICPIDDLPAVSKPARSAGQQSRLQARVPNVK